MKAITPDVTNIMVACVYCIFALLSFVVLKLSIKYFSSKNQQTTSIKDSQKTSLQINQLQKVDYQKISFGKAFFKSFFMKYTFLGSFFCSNKKYLVKEIFVFSSIAVNCFRINSIIFWPWTIGLGLIIVTFICLQIIIPYLNDSSKMIQCVDQKKQNKQMQIVDINSLQIQPYHLQLSIQSNKQLSMKQNHIQNPQTKTISTTKNYELILTTILSLISQILIVQCIMTLSLSVSNSGVLNLMSLAISLLVDQLAVRIVLGCGVYVVFFILNITKIKSFQSNYIIIILCQDQILKQVQQIRIRIKIQQINQNIQLNNQLNIFEPNQQIEQSNLSLYFQNKQRKSQPFQSKLEQEKIQAIQQQKQNIIQVNRIGRVGQDQTNYFQLFEYDIQMYKQQWTCRTVKVLKSKRKSQQIQQPQKIDQLLYFPYQQHKIVASRKQSIQNIFDNQTIQEHNNKQNNYFSHLTVVQCNDDYGTVQFKSSYNREQIKPVLQQKSVSNRKLSIYQQPALLTIQRSLKPKIQNNHTKLYNNHTRSMAKVKKISPYLVNLPSEAVKPIKKTKKIGLSKVNKQNENEINNSFTIESKVSQKNSFIKNLNIQTLE